MSSNPLPDPALATHETVPPAVQRADSVRNVFIGPNGLRAGWRIAIFFVLIPVFGQTINFVMHKIPAIVAIHRAAAPNVMTPGTMLIDEGSLVLVLLLAVCVMAVIEKRTFADYFLPLREAFGKRFWQGVPYGFAMLSLLMALIAAFHGFSIQGPAIAGSAAVKYGLLYAVGFLLVGLFEEFSFRGYLQSTLGSGIGFWPAAVILSLLFGAVHLGNAGEAWFGALMAGSFGILAAFSLSRTGNLWFPIGMHAAWDWGETYFYGVPDSGFLAQGHLLNSTLQGAKWLSGGTVGPEGSVFAFVVLAVGAAGIHFLFPTKRASY
jgi:uncharacterized protein